MSASLVGSEMCIRDSQEGVPPLGQDPVGRHRCTQERAGCDCLQGLEPVSYTHLTLPTICSV
eukprot:14308129-Alexandrium_andersonii.AAC.1